MIKSTKDKRKLSLATRIIIGFILGIATGLFLGDLAEPITLVGQIFIMLLQMPVLPYVFLSLILGIGEFKIQEGKSLMINLVVTMFVLWILTLIAVGLLPLTYPDWESASFFSTTQVAETKPFDFLSLYIPANPFHALSESLVPAVVVFSIILGVALSTLPKKNAVIEVLEPVVESLGKITNWIIEFAPYGIFALVAGISGTMNVDVLSKLWIFLIGYAGMALLLGFWILPGLVVTFTPLKYREVITASRDALVTAFATGNLFVVLPMLSDRIKQVLHEHQIDQEEVVDIIVPTAFSFPSSGKLLTLSFVLFAGWFSGFEINIAEYPTFMLAGTFTFFGSTITAIPFMLDLMQIPSDLLQLFIPIDNIVTNRFGAFTAAVFILVLTFLSITATTQHFRFSISSLMKYGAVTGALLMVTVVGMRMGSGLLKGTYKADEELVELFISRKEVPNEVYLDSIPPEIHYDASKTRLENINERGYIRVGFFRDHLPSAFISQAGELVGSDIEMAHTLAADLGVSIKFIRVDEEKVTRHLSRGEIDILMTGTSVTVRRLGEIQYTIPYQHATMAFIVRDHRRNDFTSMDEVRSMDSVRIGIYHDPYYISRLRNMLPNAVIIPLQSPRLYFRGDVDLDALAFTAESGGAWTIIYPEFSVAVPRPGAIKVPRAYIVDRNDQEFLNFMNTWISIKQADGSFESAFKYWVMGEGISEIREPRWSVIRDVLHWVD